MKREILNTDIALFLFIFLIKSAVPRALLINEVQGFGLPAAIKKSSSAKESNYFLYYKSNFKKTQQKQNHKLNLFSV